MSSLFHKSKKPGSEDRPEEEDSVEPVIERMSVEKKGPMIVKTTTKQHVVRDNLEDMPRGLAMSSQAKKVNGTSKQTSFRCFMKALATPPPPAQLLTDGQYNQI